MAAADYWSRAQLDPAYLASHGANRLAIQQAILGYGQSSQLSPELAAQYGITPDQTSAADQNPYSTTHQLADLLSGNRYAIGNTAAAHGATFSGANAAAQAGETLHAGQRNYNAQQQLASQLAGIGQQDTSALSDAYTNLANQALNTPVPQAAPVAEAPAALAPAPDVYGQPGVPSAVIAAPNAFSTLAPQNQPGMPKVKLPALPKVKTIGGRSI